MSKTQAQIDQVKDLETQLGQKAPINNASLTGTTNVQQIRFPDTTVLTSASSVGEANTASNLGIGEGVFASKSGVDLRFKSLVAGSNITLSPLPNSITISATTAGEVNTGANLGTGAGVYWGKSGAELRFKSLIAGSGVSLSADASSITIGSTVVPGEVNTASNLGTGQGVFSAKSGVNLQFKTLKAGTNVTLSSTASEITINASGGGGGATVKTKIAYIGDSLNGCALWGNGIMDWFQQLLNNGGVDCEVRSFSRDGLTFNMARNTAAFGTKTALQACIDYAPNIVIVGLGFNDLVLSVESRTLATVTSDATSLFQSLATSLPSAKIVFLRERPWDIVNGTTSTVVNRQVIPILHSIPTSGVDANCRTASNLTAAVSTTYRTRLGDLNSLFTNLSSNANIDHTFDMDLFKVLLLGLHIGDGLHLDTNGSLMLANQLYHNFRTSVTGFNTLRVGGLATYNNFANFFSLAYSDVGTYYSPNFNHDEVYGVGRQLGFDMHLAMSTWYLSTRLTLTCTKTTISRSDRADHMIARVAGAVPNSYLYARVWATSGAKPGFSLSSYRFNSAGETLTVEHGSAMGFSTGTYYAEYSAPGFGGIKDCVGPITISVTA